MNFFLTAKCNYFLISHFKDWHVAFDMRPAKQLYKLMLERTCRKYNFTTAPRLGETFKSKYKLFIEWHLKIPHKIGYREDLTCCIRQMSSQVSISRVEPFTVSMSRLIVIHLIIIILLDISTTKETLNGRLFQKEEKKLCK